MIYDGRSEDIHHFDALSGEAFDELLSRPPLTPGELLAALSERLGVLADGELARLIAEILRLLASRNIVAPLD